MKKNKMFLVVSLFAAFVLVLTACGDQREGTEHAGFGSIDEALEANNLTIAAPNTDEPMEGGTLRFALGTVGTTSFDHLESVFWRFSTETELRTFFNEPLLFVGEDFFPVDGSDNLASASFDRDAQTVTISKNVASTWADGVPLTMDDLLFSYEVIALGGAATSHRRNAAFWNVVGVCAFINYYRDELPPQCDGTTDAADHIAGLTLSADNTVLTIEFYEVDPFTFAFSFWATPTARHHWTGFNTPATIDGEAMAEDTRAREDALGNGPFNISALVPGESVYFTRNENFWRGRANLDSIVWQVVDAMAAPDLMAAGLHDVINHPQSLFIPENRERLTNVSFLSNPFAGTATWWLQFRMGDYIDGVNVPWAEPRVSTPVRQALALAVDHLGAGNNFFNGLVVPASSVFWPMDRAASWADTNLDTFAQFDMERAIQILEDAGYTFPYDGAEFRTRPDGSELYVIYAAQTGSVANENNRALEMQNWRYELGIDVRFYQGNLIDGAVFWDAMDVEVDSPIDMFVAGVGFGANPGLGVDWGTGLNSPNNLARFTSPAWQAAQARFVDEQMWDEDFRMDTIMEWQSAFMSEYVMFPTTTAIPLTAVNNRVTGFSLENTRGDLNRPGTQGPGHPNVWLWGVTQDEPMLP